MLVIVMWLAVHAIEVGQLLDWSLVQMILPDGGASEAKNVCMLLMVFWISHWMVRRSMGYGWPSFSGSSSLSVETIIVVVVGCRGVVCIGGGEMVASKF